MKRKEITLLVCILTIGMLLFAVPVLTADTFSQAKGLIPWDKYGQYSVSQFKKYGPANKPINFENIDFPLLNAAVFYETNRMRLKYGKKPYSHSTALERAAFMHTLDMAAGNFFSHQNPRNPEKREPSDRSALFGGGVSGENIATTFGIKYKAGTSVSSISSIPPHTYNSFAEALVDSWMHSSGHRANILDEYGAGYKYLGCGAYPVPNDGWHKFYATQNFSFSAQGAGHPAPGGEVDAADGNRSLRREIRFSSTGRKTGITISYIFMTNPGLSGWPYRSTAENSILGGAAADRGNCGTSQNG